MAVQPTEEAKWARDDITEVVTINGVATIVPNKAEPPDAFKNTGILARQRVSRVRINWILDLLCRYVNHLNERDNVGSVYTTTTNENAATVSERRGGTWVEMGTTTVGGETVYYFKKTA